MLNVQIKESAWKEFNEVEVQVQPETPYWFKQENGNIVLAVHLTTKYSSGWAKCYITEDGQIQTKGNEFYMLKNAKLQCAWVNEA